LSVQVAEPVRRKTPVATETVRVLDPITVSAAAAAAVGRNLIRRLVRVALAAVVVLKTRATLAHPVQVVRVTMVVLDLAAQQRRNVVAAVVAARVEQAVTLLHPQQVPVAQVWPTRTQVQVLSVPVAAAVVVKLLVALPGQVAVVLAVVRARQEQRER